MIVNSKWSVLLILLFFINCGGFSKYSRNNFFEKEGNLIRYTNKSLGVTMLVYGGYSLAESNKELKQINKKDNEINKLFYLSNSISEYYFLTLSESQYQPKKIKGYHAKTIFCDQKRYVTLKVSPKINNENLYLYLYSFRCVNN